MERHEIPAPAHEAGDVVHGFRVDAVTPIDDVKALCYECTHLATGAKLVHLHCNDRENLYSISFRTPPVDSAGEAHILEHSVLAGSAKFPLKDVFAELAKSSMSTYLNAWTFGDKTVYPVCSAVPADYWNLAEVYTDVTLRPLITRNTFLQEGWHYHFGREDDIASPLSISGVVYNEMKGAMSAPERVIGEALGNALFPDTPYAFNSGGDPERIPDLTHEGLVAFHRRYYHPSNATWFLYGDIALDERLAFVDARIRDFGSARVDSALPEQPRFRSPRKVEVPYPVAPDEPTEGKTFVGLAWMVAPLADRDRTVVLQVLGEALLGNAAAPLRKALVDSGLGQDLMYGGHEGHSLQGSFGFMLRGSERDRAGKVEALALEVLGKLASEGLDEALVEAAFHKLEFDAREIGSSYPTSLLQRMAELANYGIDPKAGLAGGAAVARMREAWLRDPDLIVRAIREWLLDNPHRVLATGYPSRTLAAETEAAFAERMAEAKARLGASELERIRAEAAALKAVQEAPEKPEALASIPRITLAEVPRKGSSFPTTELAADGATVLSHPTFSNGVLSVDLAFDASDFSDSELLLVPYLLKATTGAGAAGADYAAMATRIARATGGLEFEASAFGRGSGTEAVSLAVLRGSALGRNVAELFAIFRDLLLAADYSDGKRMKDLAFEFYNNWKSRLSRNGTAFAFDAAAAALWPAGARTEQLRGFTQVRHLRDLAADFAKDPAAAAAPLKALAAKLFSRGRLTVNLAGDPGLVADGEREALALAAALPAGAAGPAQTYAPSASRSVGIALQSQVNYVARVARLGGIGDPAAPAAFLLASIASDDYMYKKLRVQGGAYGGYSTYRYADGGLLTLGSYRDPRLEGTLVDMAGFAAFARSPELDQAVLEKGRIGAIAAVDSILSPKAASLRAFHDRIKGIRPADREAFREGLFAVTLDELRKKAAPLVEAALADAPKAVVGSRAAIEKANAAFAASGGKEAPFAMSSLDD
ncbi:MAG: insulinase family protein [Spirochaetales bacterium]|nr:insulinase family protein [Spirochaetales bacterium]